MYVGVGLDSETRDTFLLKGGLLSWTREKNNLVFGSKINLFTSSDIHCGFSGGNLLGAGPRHLV